MAQGGDKEFSQLDLGGVLRSAHDDKNKALRTTSANTSVPAQYSRVALTYNSDDSVTNAKFYLGELPEVRHVTFTADVAGSLNNTYFTLYSENDESLYHVWYNVSGSGVDPAPPNSCGIEIPIATNDPATIIKLATQRCLEIFCDEFKVQELAPQKLKISNARNGLATNTSDIGTGFTIVTIQEGTEKLLKSVDVPFDGKTKYIYNTQEKRFEAYPIADTTVTLAGEVDIKDPNTHEIINLTIVNKNTEVTQVLPNDTKRYSISVRDGKAQLRLANNATETATKYKTIYRGEEWNSNSTDVPDGKILYLLATQDNVVVEIEVWRRV
jgi:hypothetical protein